MKRIDFSASYLTWLTRKGRSYGRFQIDAACVIRDPCSGKSETYYLAPAVVAGNVYAENDLVKQPIYLFQIAVSDKRHVVFRTFVPDGDVQISFDKNSKLFEEIEFHITRNEAAVLKDFDDIDLRFQQHNSISAYMSYETAQHGRLEVEFPIKHMNIQKERRLFQVETGPILVPSEVPADSPSYGKRFSFNTAFIHFSCFDCAEITLNVPDCVNGETMCFFPQVKKLNPQIVLMADNGKRWQ